MESMGPSTPVDDATITNETIADRFPTFVHVTRLVTALVTSGLLGALFWLAVMQEGNAGRIFNHTWTGHDFPDGLGAALGYHSHARAGFVATIILFIGVAIVFALIERFLPGRGWVKGLSFAPLIYLAWGLVFAPLIHAHQVLQGDDYAYLPDTIFATRSGRWTLVSAAVASVAAGVVIARGLQLVRDADWWREKDPAEIAGTTALSGMPGLIAAQEDRLSSYGTATPGALREATESTVEADAENDAAR